MTAEEKKILTNKVYGILKESFFEVSQNDKQQQQPSRPTDNREEAHASKEKERNIIKWLTDDQENNAAVASQLWPELDDDTRRSLFSKKVRGHDSDGKPYHFTADEVNSLFRIKNTYVQKIDEQRKKTNAKLAKMITESIENQLLTQSQGGDIEGLKQDLQRAGFDLIERGEGGFRVLSKKYKGLTGEPEWVATYLPKRQEMFPSHGYFAPHPCGKLIMKICNKHGIIFNNF